MDLLAGLFGEVARYRENANARWWRSRLVDLGEDGEMASDTEKVTASGAAPRHDTANRGRCTLHSTANHTYIADGEESFAEVGE